MDINNDVLRDEAAERAKYTSDELPEYEDDITDNETLGSTAADGKNKINKRVAIAGAAVAAAGIAGIIGLIIKRKHQ